MKYGKPEWINEKDWHDASAHFYAPAEYNRRYISDSDGECRQCMQCRNRHKSDMWNDGYDSSYCEVYQEGNRQRKPADLKSCEMICDRAEYEPDEEFYDDCNNLVTKYLLGHKICMLCPDISDEDYDEMISEIVRQFDEHEKKLEAISRYKALVNKRKNWYDEHAKSFLRKLYEENGTADVDSAVENAYMYYGSLPDYGMPIEFADEDEEQYITGTEAFEAEPKEYYGWLIKKMTDEYNKSHR